MADRHRYSAAHVVAFDVYSYDAFQRPDGSTQPGGTSLKLFAVVEVDQAPKAIKVKSRELFDKITESIPGLWDLTVESEAAGYRKMNYDLVEAQPHEAGVRARRAS